MDIRLLFPTLYLAAPDFKGRDAVLTIARVSVDNLKAEGGKTTKKAVVYFEETHKKAEAGGDVEKEKRLVLNKTNARTIAAMYGWEADAWKGKRITLYPTRCDAFGKTVDCIRVRDVEPPAPVTEPAAATTTPAF